jgi:hypothetical protein
LPDERRGSCLRFLFNVLRFYRAHGVRIQRVMIDIGVIFRSRALRQGIALAQDQTPAHQTLHAKNQWQGRALRPIVQFDYTQVSGDFAAV